jgi:hypothetical protein
MDPLTGLTGMEDYYHNLPWYHHPRNKTDDLQRRVEVLERRADMQANYILQLREHVFCPTTPGKEPRKN